MCGIITVVKRKKDDSQTALEVLAMLEKQISRGQQGLGYVAFDDKIGAYTRRQTKKEIEELLTKNESQSFLFHHRYPTSTPNYADCTHPIKVSHKELKHDYYLTHNGVISNCSITHEEYVALGYVYTTEVTTSKIVKTQNSVNKSESIEYNDSESLAIDIARFIEGKQDSIKSRGSIAFTCLQVDKKNGKVLKIYFGRNSNPLTINIDENKLVLRSEGEIESIDTNKLYWVDMKTWEFMYRDAKIGEVASSYNYSDRYKDGYPATNYDEEDYEGYGPLNRGKEYWKDFDSRNSKKKDGEVLISDTLPLPVMSGKGDDDYDMMLLDSVTRAELAKVNTLIEIREEELGMIQDERDYLVSYGLISTEEDEKIRQLEDELEQLESDRDMMLEGAVVAG